MADAEDCTVQDSIFEVDDEPAPQASNSSSTTSSMAPPPCPPPPSTPVDATSDVCTPTEDPIVPSVDPIVPSVDPAIAPTPKIEPKTEPPVEGEPDSDYLIVYSSESCLNEMAAELPLEDDGTLLVDTLNIEFEGAVAVKFKNPVSLLYRIVRPINGRIKAPPGGWGIHKYVAVMNRLTTRSDGPSADPEKFIGRSGDNATPEAIGAEKTGFCDVPIGQPLAQQPLGVDNPHGSGGDCELNFEEGDMFSMDGGGGGGQMMGGSSAWNMPQQQQQQPMFDQGFSAPRTLVAGDEGSLYMSQRSAMDATIGTQGYAGDNFMPSPMPNFRANGGRPSMAMLASMGGLDAMRAASSEYSNFGPPIYPMGRGRGGGRGGGGMPRGGGGMHRGGGGGGPPRVPGGHNPPGTGNRYQQGGRGGRGGRGSSIPGLVVGDFRCDACQVTMNNNEMYKAHMIGRKHDMISRGLLKPGSRAPTGSRLRDMEMETRMNWNRGGGGGGAFGMQIAEAAPSANAVPIGTHRRASKPPQPLEKSFVTAHSTKAMSTSTTASVAPAGIGPTAPDMMDFSSHPKS